MVRCRIVAAKEHRTRITAGGRIVIPAPYRRALGVQQGDEVILVLEEEGAVRIMTPAGALERARRTIRKYVPAGRRLAEELIAERRQDYERE